MDISDMPRAGIERAIKKGKHPHPKDLAELLRAGDITPAIGEYVADYFVVKTKQRLVGRKKGPLGEDSKKILGSVLVQLVMEEAEDEGKPITKTEAISHVAKLNIPQLSRSVLESILKEP